MRRSKVSGVLAVIIGCSFGDIADAGDKAFVGTPGMPNWFDGDNWQPAGVPSQDDDVTVGNFRTAVLAGDAAIRNFTLDTGELDGSGTLLLHGRLNWKGGGMRNTVSGIATTTVELGMDLPFPSSGARTLIDRVLNLKGGTSRLSGPDGFGLGGNATLNLDKDAVFEAVNDSGGIQYIVAAPGVSNVHGTFRKTAGNSGTTRLENIEANNFGGIEVLSGRVELSGTGTAHDGSRFQVAEGAVLQFATSDQRPSANNSGSCGLSRPLYESARQLRAQGLRRGDGHPRSGARWRGFVRGAGCEREGEADAASGSDGATAKVVAHRHRVGGSVGRYRWLSPLVARSGSPERAPDGGHRRRRDEGRWPDQHLRARRTTGELGAALRQSLAGSRAGLLRRRPRRGPDHASLDLARLPRDRAQLELPVPRRQPGPEARQRRARGSPRGRGQRAAAPAIASASRRS